MKTTIEIEIDTEKLSGYTDDYLAQLWHAAQAADGPEHDLRLGTVSDAIGQEIIRRWLNRIGEFRNGLRGHSEAGHYHHLLYENGKWVAGEWVPFYHEKPAAA